MDENMNNVNEENEQIVTDQITDQVSEETQDESSGKLGLALLGFGGLAVTAGVVGLAKKIKNHKKPDDPETTEEPKQKVRGRKLTFHEKITGYVDLDADESNGGEDTPKTKKKKTKAEKPENEEKGA